MRISRAERMVSRNFLRVLAMACACAAAACGSTNVSNVTAPSNARCGSSITGLPGSLGAGGGQFPVTIATARECQWKAESDSPWLQITPATGQGEAEVSVVVAANPVGTVRTGSVVVNGTTMSVRQDAAACQITWKESSVEVPASGGSLTIGVSATAGCSWAASTTASWLRGTRTSGTGDGSAEFVANASDGSERTATLRVGDASATVTQAADAPPEPPLPGLPVPTPGPPAPTPPAQPPQPPPFILTYTGTASGTVNLDVSGGLGLAPGTYTITFSRSGTIYVRGVAGGGGGGGGKRRDDGGSLAGGGGGGGGGAASLAGQPVAVVADTTYQAVVGTGGSGGAGATEAGGNTAGSGTAGSQTYFRIAGGTMFLQLAGGNGGSPGTNTAGSGGAGGTVTAGSGVTGGAGGSGGDRSASAQTGGGASGVNAGGGGGGGQSFEQSSRAGGGPGGAGGASGGAGGNGAAGGNAGSGVTDSGGGGEGARDSNGDDSAGGGGGGGKGVTPSGGPSNRGGGGGGGGAINTGNSADRGGNGGAGAAGAMSIGIR